MQTTVQQVNWEKEWGMLVAEAWSDEKLKARLLEDPANVLRERGVEVPYGVDVRVLEDTAEIRHLVLPASPEGELADEELNCAVGRDSFSGFCYACGGDCRRCGCGRCGCGCDASE
ncbi:MAG: NHLP leader peptide family natural product precursor [Planctomycetia bacterium]|nr:NHLP leader peptide family natural product precursor [Planctomycetia bacterium]